MSMPVDGNRKDVRKKLAGDLQQQIPEAQFVSHFMDDPKGQMPALCVSARGSHSERLTLRTVMLKHKLWIHSLVLAGRESADWTEEQAEDLLDDMDVRLRAWIDANRATAGPIALDGDPEIEYPIIAGEQYLDEKYPVLVG